MDKYEDKRFIEYCPTCGQLFYEAAFNAAKEFIDSHIADPDLDNEMIEAYRNYQEELEKLEKLNITHG